MTQYEFNQRILELVKSIREHTKTVDYDQSIDYEIYELQYRLEQMKQEFTKILND